MSKQGQKQKSQKQNKETRVQRQQKPEQREEQLQEQIQQQTNPELVKTAVANPEDASPQAMEAVQRAYGNQFVQRLARQQNNAKTETTPKKPASTAVQATPKSKPDKSPSKSASKPSLQPGNNNAPIRTKLKVNDPGDEYEREAEAMADTVSRAPEHTPPVGADNNDDQPSAQRKSESESGKSGKNRKPDAAASSQRDSRDTTSTNESSTVRRSVPTTLKGKAFGKNEGGANGSTPAQRKTTPRPTADSGETAEPEMETAADWSALAEKEHAPPLGIMDGEDDNPLQRAPGSGYGSDGQLHDPVEQQIDRKRGGGRPLPDGVRGKMEDHLGSDLSGVRVHSDSGSDSLNRSLNARAFTTGSDVFFSEGEYSPHSEGGQKLLAHELTHVVQQGAAKPKPVQREEHEERPGEQDENAPEAIQREAETDQGEQKTDTAVSGGLETADPTMRQPVLQALTPFIQRKESDEEKAKKEGRKKVKKGKEKAEQKKGEKQSDKEEKGSKAGKQEKKKKQSKAKAKPKGEPKPKIKKPKQVEAKDQVAPEEMEQPPVPETGDTGSLGWPPTKSQALPDWDTEIAKYDDFKAGNLESLGVDLSGLEGDTTGLDEPITVDDPEIRRQMVQDALSGGMGGDGNVIGPMHQMGATIMDAVPFAGQLMSISKFATEGPEAWWESTKAGFENAAANIESAWKGMGEGSGWNRAASALEFIIGLLEMVNNILQFLTIVLVIVLIVLAIIFAVGTVLAAIPFTAAIGTPMVSFSSPLLPIVPLIILQTALYMVQLNLIIRVLRELAIAFRVIDILYYESDPDKLMERQAKLAEHVSGLNQAAHENITPGINKKGEGEAEPEQMIAGIEGLEEPLVSDFNIERVNTKEDAEKQEYKTAWMKKYGVRSTADEVHEELMGAEVERPPMLEYGVEKEKDVVGRIDRNAIAIVELKRQRMGLATQKQETAESLNVARNQKQIIGSARNTVAENQRVAGEHQQDIETKLEKQDELQGKTQEAGKKGEKGGGHGVEAQGLAGIILKLLQPLMPAVSKAGENVDGKKKKGVKEGPDTTLQGTDATVDSAKQGEKEAQQREKDTKKAQGEAKQSQAELAATEQYLAGREGKADEGISKLEEHKARIDETSATLAEEEQRLVEERTAAINDATEWMATWREQRAELFNQMEQRLQERLPEQEEEESEEGKPKEEEKKAWDIYSDRDDQGELKGLYATDEVKEKKREEGEEAAADFSLGE